MKKGLFLHGIGKKAKAWPSRSSAILDYGCAALRIVYDVQPFGVGGSVCEYLSLKRAEVENSEEGRPYGPAHHVFSVAHSYANSLYSAYSTGRLARLPDG